MGLTMKNKYLYITLLSFLGLTAEAQEQLIAQAPRLVVSITIDQLRTELSGELLPTLRQRGTPSAAESG